MALPDIFSTEITRDVISRIEQLTPETQPLWGTMSVDKMLAHCNVTYEYIYTTKHKKPNFLMAWVLSKFVRKHVVNEIPYAKNVGTAPEFKIKINKNFEDEKQRLCNFIKKVHSEGRKNFEGRISHSFNKMTAEEWNNMFYKHLDHHLRQFGV